MCGLYRMEGGMPVFVILTKDSVEDISYIHDRMPVMLPESRVSDWIRPEVKPEEIMRDAVGEMFWERVEE